MFTSLLIRREVMNAVIPYVVLAFTVIMGGLACASLVQSSEERWNRQSFFYKYGTFLFYSILAVIGVFVLIGMYYSGGLPGFVLAVASGGGASALWGSGTAVLPRILTPFAVEEARAEGLLEKLPAAAPEQKYRRQVGHGRYHT